MPRPHTPVNTPTVMAEGDWLAPRAEHPVDATVTLPGSKSLTNRYLVLAALWLFLVRRALMTGPAPGAIVPEPEQQIESVPAIVPAEVPA